MNAARVFMDVSYTRTQHVHVGITRTVRRLEQELRQLTQSGGTEFATVSFHTGGFRLAPGALASSATQGVARASDKPAARLFRWITGAFFRKVVVAALCLPWSFVSRVWATTSAWTFDFLARNEPAVEFRSGDVLLLFDASWNYPVWIAARRARQQGARVVLLMYDLIPLRHPQFCFALVPHVFRLWLDRMLPLADGVVCISHATEQDLRRFAAENGSALPATGHFRLGSDPIRTSGLAGSVRPELEAFVQAPGPCFAAIGSFEPKKNYGFLVKVFEHLWQRGETARLLIMGRESAECAELIAGLRRHLEQGRRLLTLFDASDAEVAYAYGHCRALIFPSMAEGFGLPLVEARTRGCRVIGSDLPVFSELADAGVTLYPAGSHAELERRILELTGPQPDTKPALMEPFTWQDSARQCLQRIDALLPRQALP